MFKILSKLTLLAGVALLFGAASSAQAQNCSSGGYVVYPQYAAPVYSGVCQTPVYRYTAPVRRACPANCGCSQCRSRRAAAVRYQTTVRRYVQRPVYRQPSYSPYVRQQVYAAPTCSSGYHH